MNSKGQLQAQLCVTATTAFFAGCGCANATASQMHRLQSGETVESLSRKYHVSVKQILVSNHLSPSDVLLDGRSLLIPDAPRPTVVPSTMQRSARIHGDRISVRLGPGPQQPRVTLCDNGSKLTVTAEAAGWYQVTLSNGKSGWVRADFLQFTGAHLPANLARKGFGSDKSPAPSKMAIAAAAHSKAGSPSVSHKHPADATVISAAQRKHAHAERLAAARRHKEERTRHQERLAAEKRRRRHLEQIASAHAHHKHDNSALARHRQRLEAAAEAHRRHIAEAAARHRKHLAEAAERAHRRSVATSSRYQSSGRLSHRYRPEAESPSVSNDVVRTAYAYRGTHYVWGSSRPGGFDCSGFTKYIYGRKGVSLPRTAAEQFHSGRRVDHKNLKPGDLVFFHTTRGGISHVGMYVGKGKFIHSSSRSSGGVRVDNLDGYYKKAFRGAVRVQKGASEGSGE